MSTPETPERSRRHRRVTVLSVATAVLLAGGGGAYWASNALEPAGDATAASDDRRNPPPLVLDGLGTAESGDVRDRGVAPGEPDPNGTVYEAEGELPEGPATAPVHRPDDEVTRAEVKAIAAALEVPGTPEQTDGRWRVGGPGDGSGPLLTVDGSGGGAWSYVRYRPAADDLCGRPGEDGPRTLPAPCPERGGGRPADRGGAAGDGGDPVSPDRAKQSVRPALEPLNLTGARLDASSAYGALRVVSAQPRVGGLPVQDWTSSFTVDSTGQLVRGHGRLGDLVKGAEYPVMTAAQTLKTLNAHRGATLPEIPSCDDAPPPRPKNQDTDLGGYPKADDVVTCAPPAASGHEDAATVTDATFGLATEYSKGEPVLVPAWIYQVEKRGAEGTYEVAFPAVERAYLRPAAPDRDGPGGGDGGDTPSSPGGRELLAYRADGRELTVIFWGGVCEEYRATAKPADGKVSVRVEVRNPKPDQVCVEIAKKQRVTVKLGEPLDGREVVDARSGETLPKKK